MSWRFSPLRWLWCVLFHGGHRFWLHGNWSIERPLTEWKCRDCGVIRLAEAGQAPGGSR